MSPALEHNRHDTILHLHARESPSDACHIHWHSIPNHELPVYSTRAHSAHNTLRAPLKWPDACDGVLMHSEKLGVRRHIPTSSVATRVRISERVKRAAVEAANTSSFCSRPPPTRARVIQRANECPACFRSREHHWLAIVTSRDNAIFASPGERDIRQGTDPDVLDDGPPGIDNADRTVMTCERRSNKNTR